MADSTNERPKRKLTVKNFSVIKEAELEFGKITVLIGPQASGKSLLCKLAFFMGQIVPETISSLLLLRMPYKALLETAQKEFIGRFPEIAWGDGPFQVSYETEALSVSFGRRGASNTPLEVIFNSGHEDRYAGWLETHQDEGSAATLIPLLESGAVLPDWPVPIARSIYIPTGRAFFSTPNRGFASVSGKNLDWITQRFSTEIDWEYRAMTEAPLPTSDLLPQFAIDTEGLLGGKVLRENGTLLFKSDVDGRQLPFGLLSSGTLELLPLLNPLAALVLYVSSERSYAFLNRPFDFGPIFVEEPELGIFPGSQYELMKLFAWLATEDRTNFSFVITTHSPYTLTAFNNLIFAGQLGHNSAIRKKIPIDEKYWIEPGSFRAYCISDGVLKPILSKSGLIDAEYLDSVSETIGSEFDSLLRLEYESTKAS